MLTLDQHFEKEYRDSPMRSYFGTYNTWKANWIAVNGVTRYFQAYRGQKASVRVCEALANHYVLSGERDIAEIPMLLVMIERLYDIEIPCEGGILSAGYWRDHFDRLSGEHDYRKERLVA